MQLLKKANGNIPRTEIEKEEMILEASFHYAKFLEALGFDWTQDKNSEKTPYRVAKAWINDIISGCVEKEPDITSFPNEDGYEGMVVQTGIPVRSLCSHHNLPITGVAHVAYIPSLSGKVIGLSKLNRIVGWITKRPQLQEAATQMVADMINEKCEGNLGVAVMLSCKHLCTCHRGVYEDSVMNTMIVTEAFKDVSCRNEFLEHIKIATK